MTGEWPQQPPGSSISGSETPKVTGPSGQTRLAGGVGLSTGLKSSISFLCWSDLWSLEMPPTPPPSLTGGHQRGGLTSSCPLSHMSKAHVLCPMSRSCWWKRAESSRTGDFQEDVRTLLYGINENISLPYSPNEARLQNGAKNNPDSPVRLRSCSL